MYVCFVQFFLFFNERILFNVICCIWILYITVNESLYTCLRGAGGGGEETGGGVGGNRTHERRKTLIKHILIRQYCVTVHTVVVALKHR